MVEIYVLKMTEKEKICYGYFNMPHSSQTLIGVQLIQINKIIVK